MNTIEQKVLRELIQELRQIAWAQKEIAVGVEAIRVELKKKRMDEAEHYRVRSLGPPL